MLSGPESRVRPVCPRRQTICDSISTKATFAKVIQCPAAAVPLNPLKAGHRMALFGLGLGLLLEVVRRAFAEVIQMERIAISAVALLVYIFVLRLCSRHRNVEVHFILAWSFTRVGVVAIAVMILTGLAVSSAVPGYFALVVRAAIGAYVIREAFEIISEAQQAGRVA